MRSIWAKTALRLQSIVSIQLCQSLQKTLDVVDLPRMHNIKIECADRRPLEDRRDAAHNNEVDSVVIQRPDHGKEISRWHFGRGFLEPSRRIAATPQAAPSA